MSSDNFEWLQSWYVAHCDDEWEESYGIKIESLDNPGWSLEVNLVGTDLEGRILDRQFTEKGEHEWMDARSDGQQFYAAGGPRDLGRIVAAFRAWAEGRPIEGY